MSAALSLEVELQPEWTNVVRTSQAVALLALSTYGDRDMQDALAMISAELLENALKYADPQQLVKLTIQEDERAIVVTVTNAVVRPQEVERLAERLAWLKAQPSPAAAWSEALLRAGTGGERAGLGILRIAYEGGSRIDFDASQPGTLTVRASMTKSTAGA